MILGQELGQQQLEWNLDREADRDICHIGDTAASSDLGRQRVHVVGVDVPGEADDNARVERLAGLQLVDRVLTAVV